MPKNHLLFANRRWASDVVAVGGGIGANANDGGGFVCDGGGVTYGGGDGGIL